MGGGAPSRVMEAQMDDRLGLPPNTLIADGYRIERVIGSGGFGITYLAEDLNLKIAVAIKEYYPAEWGARGAGMQIGARSVRDRPTFEWGRANFLYEARTLARFQHSSIVRVRGVLEANSTAYMVMDFERGRNFEAWLTGLGRLPTQEELDRIALPLLDALEIMHAENFLHRDIAPDNIVVRENGTPVLLDFGAARGLAAEKSRTLTGIVKAGYSPFEQYATDARLQGAWTDLYALGATLYRAVAGHSPEEATLRMADDRMATAIAAGRGMYREGFLAAIDACLKVRHRERPQSVAELREMLCKQQPKRPVSRAVARTMVTAAPQLRRSLAPALGRLASHWPAVATAILVASSGAYAGIGYTRWRVDQSRRLAAADEDAARRRASAEAALARSRVAAQAERDFQSGFAACYGLGVPRDYAKARALYERSAAAGNGSAMDGLAWLYRNAWGVARDYAMARDWSEKSAALGTAAGMYTLGVLHEFAEGVPRDYATAREWYEKAAAYGNSGGMFRLGWLYQNGLGVVRDYARSRAWYEKAAGAGNGDAMINLAWLYRKGLGVTRDYARVREWSEKAAALGNAAGMYSLGVLNEIGEGVPQDYARAREWYEKAAALGNADGMFRLGWLNQNGWGFVKNPAKAHEWYARAAAQGSVAAMANLGWLYEKGLGSAADLALARQWYEKAAAAGEETAMRNLALFLDEAKGGPADFPRAARLLLQAARARNAFAVRDLLGDLAAWNRHTRTELKRELARRGLFGGPLDEAWDDGGRLAFRDYMARGG
jgi:TPR repeat protein